MDRHARCLAIAAIATVAVPTTRCGAPDRVAGSGQVILFNDNGAWSWFEDERAVIDPATGTLLVSSVANAAGFGGAARDGNVEVVAYDLATGTSNRTVLHAGLEGDDHNSAALYVRPDGRYLAMYSKHDTEQVSRWRITRQPRDPTDWLPERTLQHDAWVTYSNLYPATDEHGDEVLYNFVRSAHRDPHLLVSRDHGSTWQADGRLLDGPGRPYVRYAADSTGRIHLITTEQHPHDYPNSIYHGVVADGRLLRSDGTVVDANLSDDHAASPTSLTKIFSGDATRRAWTLDLRVDASGNPIAAFSVHTDSGHRYYYARFDGTAWRVHPLAHAGSALYPAEPHYTGLVALDPNNPWRVFVSTDAHPDTGTPLISNQDGRRHHELYEGITVDGGARWKWTAVTTNSTVDNIRPIVPRWDSHHTALLWLRGTYTSYHRYNLAVVGVITTRRNVRDSG